MEKVTLNHKTKDKVRRVNLKKIIPKKWIRRVMGSLRKTSKSGVSSTKSPGATVMNEAQNIH
jgi:hypothetical protein